MQTHIKVPAVLESIHDVWVINKLFPVQARGACVLMIPANWTPSVEKKDDVQYLQHLSQFQKNDKHVFTIVQYAAVLQFAIRAIHNGDPVKDIKGMTPENVASALKQRAGNTVGGGRYQIGGRNADDCIIYVGPRGGKYIKRNGVLVSLARIQRKA
jgi:hypothetical protein